MPILTTNQSVSLLLSAGGGATLSSNAGRGSFEFVPTNGPTRRGSWGPLPHRLVIDAENGGSLQINCSTGTLVYNVSGQAKPAEGFGSGLRASIAAYKRGLRTRPPIITGIGDSNFSAQGAGAGGLAYDDAFEYGPIRQITEFTPTLDGLPIRKTAFFGDGNANILGVALSAYNPRAKLGAGWTRAGFGGHLFGMFIAGDQASAGYFEYNFGSPITDLEIYAVVNGTNSNAVGVYNSANVLQGTINTNGAASATKFSVTGNFPDGIFKLKNNDGARPFYLMGAIGWNSAEKAIILAVNSYAGSLAANYTQTTNAWDGMSFYPAMQPDLAIVALTINDINGSTSSSSYTTSLSYILDFVCRYGDAIVSTGGYGNTAPYSNGQAQIIELAAKKVAGSYNAPFISMHAEWGRSWAATNAIGYEFDGLHRTRAGYRDQARVYANILASIVGG